MISEHVFNDGFVRLSSILGPDGPIPISRSSWWQGVRDGRFPAPLKIGPRTTVWRVSEVSALIDQLQDEIVPHNDQNSPPANSSELKEG
ncbi:helix-turn-helix transcriptional regulator [Notoacmeibacter ruber]|uniref:AlpA family phage regulatory protein n=1 Tax=Notoacmeibacter ruber TaxID=2670375 RepID=A0A3L7JI21_9HYPH|nr:AlpA family phage regulatory protein [Notoacmeibacter ruber]RLQ89271.1 AlpA family phage regulatory protein [Notoacmeibacter ruber]